MTPVYLFTGFLDSGKSTLIKATLEDPGFMENAGRTLILRFEEGETDFDETFLKEHNACMETYDDVHVLTPEKCRELDTVYHPFQVFIEWNGTMPVTEDVLKNMPDFWPLVEILTTVDGSTFAMYMTNMRSMLFEQLRYSDVVIVNRCTTDMSYTMFRGNIKAINRRAQMFFEEKFGKPCEFKEGRLPFDITKEPLDISDDDYGLWYMDVMENPEKYNDKKIILRGAYAEDLPGYKQSFIFGRRAMVCCQNDTSLCGITVTGVRIEEMQKGEWIQVSGKLKTVDLENGGKTVLLYADGVYRCPVPDDPYVYFS